MKDNSDNLKSLWPMRINKYLAHQKFSTRRGADELITKKLVFINGRVAVLGDKVKEGDEVEVKQRGPQTPRVYFAYNKPVGIVTHSAGRGEQEITDVLRIPGFDARSQHARGGAKQNRIFPIGRLDKESSGLIILTNDGRITQPLLDKDFDHEKEYIVSTKEKLRTSFEEKMEAGVQIENEKTLPCRVKILGDKKFSVILTEGKKHQIRRMCVALFQEVKELKRVRIMNIKLGDLNEGQFRKIDGEEIDTFLQSLGLEE